MDGVYEPFLQGWFLPLVFALSFFVLPTTFTAAGLPSLGTQVAVPNRQCPPCRITRKCGLNCAYQAADGSYPDFSPATVGGVAPTGT